MLDTQGTRVLEGHLGTQDTWPLRHLGTRALEVHLGTQALGHLGTRVTLFSRLFFLIYMNNLSGRLSSNPKLFADENLFSLW